MTDNQTDELWPHFSGLWADLRSMNPRLLLAGGYGLFLKQKWLISKIRHLGISEGEDLLTESGSKLIANTDVPTLIAIDQWKDQTPRVTNDLDFVVELDLIASPAEQTKLHGILANHEFNVVAANARWQFMKVIDETHQIVVDFHAPTPIDRNDVRVQSRRVKPRPSLGNHGIQGRVNAEAIGCELAPFSFAFDGVEIVIPNAVTLALMKVVAMRDRRLASKDETKSPAQRDFESKQSHKHACDVCRVIAMVTRDEMTTVPSVLAATRETTVFTDVRNIVDDYFLTDNGYGTRLVAEEWDPADLNLIKGTLIDWFLDPRK